MLNERLATHYGIAGVPRRGDAAGRAQARGPPRRPAHAGLGPQPDAPTARGTGPVHRGVWVLESIVGKPPPPPPANVPALNTPAPGDAESDGPRRSWSCTAPTPTARPAIARIDPLGLAFDNYDADRPLARRRDGPRRRRGRPEARPERRADRRPQVRRRRGPETPAARRHADSSPPPSPRSWRPTPCRAGVTFADRAEIKPHRRAVESRRLPTRLADRDVRDERAVPTALERRLARSRLLRPPLRADPHHADRRVAPARPRSGGRRGRPPARRPRTAPAAKASRTAVAMRSPPAPAGVIRHRRRRPTPGPAACSTASVGATATIRAHGRCRATSRAVRPESVGDDDGGGPHLLRPASRPPA